jgi:hypothetical protein
MFYRLPFPDLLRLEKLQERIGIATDAAAFLDKMQDDLGQDRAMADLRSGWVKYLNTEMTTKGASTGKVRKTSSQRHVRNKTPTTSEEEDAVVFALVIRTVSCI